jgi:hypothetical protein
VNAQPDFSCKATVSSSSVVAYPYRATALNQGQTGIRGIFAPLRVRLTADGGVRVRGVIRLRGDSAFARGTAAGEFVRLVAIRSSGVASCADADGDGTPGLVRLAADFRTVGTGERVAVVVSTPGQDISTSGRYRLTVEIGGETFTTETHVRVIRR